MLPTSRALGAILTVLLAGCGGSDSSGSAATVAPPVTSAVTSAVTAAATSADDSDGGGGCDLPSAVKDAVTDSHVTRIGVNGGCHNVSVETTYARADFAKAKAICDSVGKVAYKESDSLLSVNVEGPDGHDLAAGLKGMDCIGEP